MHDEGFSFLTSGDGWSVGLTARSSGRAAKAGARFLASRFLALGVHLPGSLTIGSGRETDDRKSFFGIFHGAA